MPRDRLDMDLIAFPATDGGYGVPTVEDTLTRANAKGSEVALHALQDAGLEPPTEGLEGARHLQSKAMEASSIAHDRGMEDGKKSSSPSLPRMPERPQLGRGGRL